MLKRYQHRRVLITGGGSGIGQATTVRILGEGGVVVAADVSEKGLDDTRRKAQGDESRLHTVTMDVASESSVREGIARSVALMGGIDFLVNAAGILRSSHTASTSLAAFETTIRVNLTGTFLVIRECLPHLIKGNSPAVVNFSSTSAAFAHPYMAAYAASKGGIQSMTHALAAEYSQQGVRFTAVQPGSISSGMTDGSGESKQSAGPGLPPDADMNLMHKLQPALGDGFAGPHAVAGVVAMLGSEDGQFVTGTEIRIDGGAHY